jgi:hypothetical protein
VVGWGGFLIFPIICRACIVQYLYRANKKTGWEAKIGEEVKRKKEEDKMYNN